MDFFGKSWDRRGASRYPYTDGAAWRPFLDFVARRPGHHDDSWVRKHAHTRPRAQSLDQAQRGRVPPMAPWPHPLSHPWCVPGAANLEGDGSIIPGSVRPPSHPPSNVSTLLPTRASHAHLTLPTTPTPTNPPRPPPAKQQQQAHPLFQAFPRRAPRCHHCPTFSISESDLIPSPANHDRFPGQWSFCARSSGHFSCHNAAQRNCSAVILSVSILETTESFGRLAFLFIFPHFLPPFHITHL